MLAPPPEPPGIPRKVVVLTIATAVVLVCGLVIVLIGLRHFEKLASQQRDRARVAPAGPGGAVAPGFEISAVSLQKEPGGNGLYAVGTVLNASGRRRSQITVEFELLDAEGQTVQVARAYRPIIEPGAKWQVKVPVASDTKAVSARLASIREGP